jgi:Uma2 family endonuclease
VAARTERPMPETVGRMLETRSFPAAPEITWTLGDWDRGALTDAFEPLDGPQDPRYDEHSDADCRHGFSMAIDEHIHRFSSNEYWRMADSGVFDEARVELLEGLVVDMSPQSEDHVRPIQELIGCWSGPSRMLRVQFPMDAAEGWVPEPDFAIAAPNDEFRTPGQRRAPVWASLVVEVSVTTKRTDLRKAQVYATAGVPTYWIVDVVARTVLEHTGPGPDGYTAVAIRRGPDMLDAGVDGMAPTTVDALFVP